MFQHTPAFRSRLPLYLKGGLAGVFAVLAFGVPLVSLVTGPAPVAHAATNSTINFQARLQSASGAIVADGFYNVQFKLYSASAPDGGETPVAGGCTTNPGGVADEDCLWTETYFDSNGATAGNDNRVRVQNGYLSVQLGSQTGFPSTINWDQQLWLTLNIGGTTQTATPTYDGEMNPRLALGAVPYAFKAGQLAKQTGSFQSTLDFATQTGSRSILLPDESGTVCLRNSSACGFLTGSAANGSYIQNTTTPQSGANFNIQGNGTIGGNLVLGGAAVRQGLNDVTGGTGGWFRIGTVTLPQNGSVANMRIYAGTGYNATDTQNGWVDLVIRTGNGSSTGTAGFGASAYAVRYGKSTSFASEIKLRSNVAGASANQFEVFMNSAAWPGDGFYTVDTSDGGSWTAGLTTASDPGVASSTVYVVPQQFDIMNTLGVVSGAVSVTGTLAVSGNVSSSGGTFSGNGSGLTTLNAGNLSSGTVASARLSGVYNNVTGTGALDAGTITSNFGNINNGSSGISSNLINATTGLQTGGTTRIDASGNITGATVNVSGSITGGIVYGTAGDFVGVRTTNTSNLYNGQYTKLGSCTLTGQFQDCHLTTLVNMYGDGSGTTVRAQVNWRVKQQAAFGGNPNVMLEVTDTNTLTAANFTSVVISNAGPTVVELWGMVPQQYQTWAMNPLANAGSVRAVLLSSQPFQAALPAGTQNAAVYSDTQFNTVNSTGYRINGTNGANTTCTGGQFLQNAVVAGGIVTGGGCASPTDTGVTTVGTFSTTNAAAGGATISGAQIIFQAASATAIGMVTTSAQTFAGAKTFNNNVTIGTSGTAAVLDVYGTTQVRGTNFNGGVDGPSLAVNGAYISIGDPVTAQTMTNGIGIKFNDAGTAHLSMRYLSSANRLDFCSSSSVGNLTCDTNSELMSLNLSNSRVGISNTSPGYKLDVNGDINISTGSAYRINGTAGASTTCTGGQFLQNAVVAGGIVTGGACAAGGAGGVTTVGTFSTTNTAAGGATISGTQIIFQAAGTGAIGMVTTGAQSFAGAKTFTGDVVLGAGSNFSIVTGSSYFDMTNGTGYFATTSGENYLNGNITVASGKTMAVNGAVTFQNASNGNDAFRVRNSANQNLLKVDTSLGRVFIGDSTTYFPKLTFGDVGANGRNAYLSEYFDGVNGDTDALQYQGKNGHYFTTGDGTQTTNFRLNNTGKALFKNTSNGASAFEIQVTDNSPLFSANSSTYRIGIGTNAPTATLDVNGAISQTGYVTQDTQNLHQNKWAKMAECLIDAQYDVCSMSINIMGTKAYGTQATMTTVNAHVDQYAAIGTVPAVKLNLSGSSKNISADDIQAVIVTVGGDYRVELYGRITEQYQRWYYAPTFNLPTYGTSRWQLIDNSPAMLTDVQLPAGPKVVANYATTYGKQEAYTDTRNVTGGTTVTINSPATVYYLQSNSGTTNFDLTTTYNLTGLRNIEGSVAYITIRPQKGVTATGLNHYIDLEINGQYIAYETSGWGTAAFTDALKSVTVIYINGQWRVMADNENDSDTYDLAEWIPFTGTKPQPGQLLSTGDLDTGASAKLSGSAYDSTVIGVVTSAPNMTMGKRSDQAVPMALTGRVPVRVSTENGPIQPGDYLTASSTPGVAMKATQPGRIIGTAFTGYNGTGEAMVTVQLAIGYAAPPVSQNVQVQVNDLQQSFQHLQAQLTGLGTELNTQRVNTVNLTVTGDATIYGDLVVGGTTKLFKLSVGGQFRLNGTDAPTLEVLDAAGRNAQSQRDAVVSVNGNDNVGTITFTAGTNPTNLDLLVKLTFHTAFEDAPQLVLSPQGRESAALQFFSQDVSKEGFKMGALHAPEAGKTYVVTYHAL